MSKTYYNPLFGSAETAGIWKARKQEAKTKELAIGTLVPVKIGAKGEPEISALIDFKNRACFPEMRK